MEKRFCSRDGMMVNQIRLDTELGFLVVEEKISLSEQKYSNDPVAYRLYHFDKMVKNLRDNFETIIRREQDAAQEEENLLALLRSPPASPPLSD